MSFESERGDLDLGVWIWRMEDGTGSGRVEDGGGWCGVLKGEGGLSVVVGWLVGGEGDVEREKGMYVYSLHRYVRSHDDEGWLSASSVGLGWIYVI